ncbi:M23 family metallopeptidase [Paenibacillus prosopidis]|uniref:Stage IV sporulation protein FA n=1 Tax=Paenibacillus prosopidis TaxID=630520 RepID=A0A368VLN2_9BACL|nr:M23 family metallopeptidase [Paenibacillus prosopidis]RCW42611.1 stage IV sporulation protein FA [Paenibacillus prosopidis]
MQTRDGVKQRRQQKIKSLLERQPSAAQTEDIFPEPADSYNRAFIYPDERDELDPEALWKTNPNPWASWGGDRGNFDKRSFIKGPELSNNNEPPHNRKRNSFLKELQWKLAIALLMFAAVWAIFRYDTEWTLQGQALVKQALTDEIDFTAAAAWYRETFAGAPSFIPIFEEEPQTAIGADGTVKLPIVSPLPDGSLVRTFAELLNGIELAGTSEEQVVAAETGRVLQLTDQDESGSTIVIQHANHRVTVYGKLGQTEVQVNDWVEAGDPIGKLLKSEGMEPSLLYFAVKQNDQYIDPVDVIPID